MKPLRKEKITWSPNLAYAVGLITTDGSLSKNGRTVEFTSKDKQLIKTFKDCLGLKNRIGLKRGGFSSKNCYRVQFGDIVFYRWLLKIGLKPNKTRVLNKLMVPEKFFFDFLRGVFDGDGSCYSYWDRRWPNSYMFYVYFNSSSYSFIHWLQEVLKKLLGIRGSISFTRREWRLKYAKRESVILLSKIYHSNNIPCLKRKSKKIKNFLKINNVGRKKSECWNRQTAWTEAPRGINIP